MIKIKVTKKDYIIRFVTMFLVAIMVINIMPMDLLWGQETKESVNFSIYRASYVYDNFTEIIEKDIYADTPSYRIYTEAENNGLVVTAQAWSEFQNVLKTADDLSNIIDITCEKKDVYEGIIFEIFESSSEYSKDFDTSELNGLRKCLGVIKTNLSTEYGINIAENNNLLSLSKEQKLKLGKITQACFNDNWENDVVISEITDVFDAVEYMDDFADYVEYVLNCIKIRKLSSEYKALLVDMLEMCSSSDNQDLWLALTDCLVTINAAEDQLKMKLLATGAGMAFFEVAKKGISGLWSEVKNDLIATNPYAAVFWVTYKTSTFVTNKAFATDSISENTIKMGFQLKIGDILKKSYEKAKKDFSKDRNESSARKYLAAVDVYYNYLDADCDNAISFVEAVSESTVAKIEEFFGETLYKDTIDVIKIYQKNYKEKYNVIVKDGWLDSLKDDYPELFEEYSSEQKDNYDIHTNSTELNNHTLIANLESAPQGYLDTVDVSCDGLILTCTGWVVNPGNLSQSIYTDLYFGGPAGSTNAVGYRVKASALREDVDTVFPGYGKYHGFDFEIETKSLGLTGWIDVYAYGINPDGSECKLLNGCPKTVYITEPIANDITLQSVVETYSSESAVVNFEFQGDGICEIICSAKDEEVCQPEIGNIDWDNGNAMLYIYGKKAGVTNVTLSYLDAYGDEFYSKSLVVNVNVKKESLDDRFEIHLNMDTKPEDSITVDLTGLEHFHGDTFKKLSDDCDDTIVRVYESSFSYDACPKMDLVYENGEMKCVNKGNKETDETLRVCFEALAEGETEIHFSIIDDFSNAVVEFLIKVYVDKGEIPTALNPTETPSPTTLEITPSPILTKELEKSDYAYEYYDNEYKDEKNEAEIGDTFSKDGIRYIIVDIDEVSIMGADLVNATNVVIPEMVDYNGCSFEVVSIGENAFKGNESIVKVSINADLIDIGDKAFYGCSALKYLYINGDLESIGRKAFYKCRKLKKIVIKSDMLEDIGKNAFAKIYKKAAITVLKTMKAEYKQLLKSAGLPKKAKIK